MNDSNDELRSRLDSLGSRASVKPANDALASVEQTARRRSHRTKAAGVAAIAAAVVGGFIFIGSDNEPESSEVVSAGPTPSAEAAEPTPTPEHSEPSPATEPEATPVPQATVDAEVPDQEAMDAATDEFSSGSEPVFAPWDDGVISLEIRWPAQTLPSELPAEVQEAFPPEVVTFFEDAGGLPPTIDEATAMLTEAGLIDEVQRVLADNPTPKMARLGTTPRPLCQGVVR